MSEIYMYADETGNLDLTGSGGASRYFGFGTAVFPWDHGREIWEGMRLRCDLERRGVALPKGLHAKDDSHVTRGEVFDVIEAQCPRLDATFLYKNNAHPAIRERSHLLYKWAWYSHFRTVLPLVSRPGDSVYVIVATFGTNRRLMDARAALADVCDELSANREIVLCVWEAQSVWGIQVADYGLWAVQRSLEGRPCKWFVSHIEPILHSMSTPWGKAR